jgi:cytochrome c-type biogenesis protein CcmH
MVMFVFWLAAVLLVLAALALLLPPLLRDRAGAGGRRSIERELAQLRARHQAGAIDDAAYAAERQRLGHALADAIADATPGPAPARTLAIALAIGVPAATLALYLALGRVDAIAPGPAGASAAATAASGGEPGAPPVDMATAIASLEARLAQAPDDVEGWLLLARSYRATEQFAQMQRATASALALAPGSPDVLVEHAEASTLNSPERRFAGPARELLEQALATDGNHQKALWLLGIAELQADRPAQAVVWWQRLRTLLADGDPVAQRVDQQIAQAQAQAGMPVAPTPAAPATGNDPAAAPGADAPPAPGDAPQLLVTVTLAPALQDRVGAGDTLFVFVRAPGGGPPLAIRRVDAPTFPATLTLGPADRMLAGVQMSTGAEVVVGARISRSGQAQAQPGDLDGEPAALTLAASGTLALTIDREVR